MSEHVQRCRQMIEEQVAQLGTLRNANPRDPGFKLWRQNTLTVLQRVWPGDSTRSERFRRIAFTPSHGKPDGQTLRDWYTRGCTDASAYLVALLEMIAREGVPPAPSVKPEALPSSAGAREDDFPVLDLPSASAKTDGVTIVLGQGDSLADAAAIPGTDERDLGSPAPPQLKVQLKGPVTTPQGPQPVIPQRPASLSSHQQKNSNAPDGDEPRGPAQLPAQLAGKLPPPPAPEALESAPSQVPVLKVEPAKKQATTASAPVAPVAPAKAAAPVPPPAKATTPAAPAAAASPTPAPRAREEARARDQGAQGRAQDQAQGPARAERDRSRRSGRGAGRIASDADADADSGADARTGARAARGRSLRRGARRRRSSGFARSAAAAAVRAADAAGVEGRSACRRRARRSAG
ncbi:MAG: hypothetical protein IPJ04_13640 [Candidatus Eisenbacteria bacterium]|nr:hypothetical protein [Candidatus Eisenbacteria bacterium]